jgi:16S rRNA (guanine(966)-N(2))-methyltransferase RsmD
MNVAQFQLEGQTEIFRNDAARALQALVKRKAIFDGIFLDPPYKEQKLEALLFMIEENNLLSQEGFIVAEYAKEVSLAAEIGNLEQIRNETYGITGVSIFKKRRKLE